MFFKKKKRIKHLVEVVKRRDSEIFELETSRNDYKKMLERMTHNCIRESNRATRLLKENAELKEKFGALQVTLGQASVSYLDMCQNCEELQEENVALQAENGKLRRLFERYENMVPADDD